MTFFYDLNKKLSGIGQPTKQLNESVVVEKWDTETKVSPEEKGKYAGKSKAELLKSYNALKKSGPHKKGTPEFGKMRELAFAIRAKSDWGKVADESVEEGMIDTVKQGAQSALQAIGQTLGHGSDEDMIRDLQKKAGVPVTGKVQPQQQGQQPQGQKPMAEDDIEEGPEVFKLKADAAKKAGEKEFRGPDGKMYPVKEGRGAKPDFLDVDKDGNRKESFKKAVADKKKGNKEEDLDEAMFPGSKIGDKLRSMKQNIGRTGSAKLAMGMAPAAGAGAAAGTAMQAGGAALFAPALGAGALGGAAAALGGFLTYKGLNWLAQKLFGTKEEALEFATAHLKAANAGQPQFAFQGKTYPVKVKSPEEAQDLYYKVKNLQSQIHEGTLNEGWDDMLKDVEKRRGGMKPGEKIQGHKGEIEKTATGIRHTRKYDPKTGETDSDDDNPTGEKRGRGRPKKDKAPERVTSKAYKHKGGRKMSKEEIEEAIATLEGHGYAVSRLDELSPETIASYQKKAMPQAMDASNPKAGQRTAGVARTISRPTSEGEQELDEKAVSKQQQKFMGMVHAMQKGEKVKGASKELKKVAKTMKPKDVKDFAATKHEGLPKKKKKEVEETTVAGAVATSTAAPKSKGKGGMTFGKGIYDSLNRDLEAMISESMNVSVNMSMDEHGEPHKNITVSAEGEAAEQLAQLLNLAGMAGQAHGHDEVCSTCGSEDCGCNEEMVDENAPDWPTEPETTGGDDPHLNRWAGGLNKPKETGQTTIPVVNRDPARGSIGPMAMAEDKDLGMKLYAELKSFKA